ncbi:DUF4192 domain-containing protein [Rhodococcus pyridinivorans]|uniref:DUF4192 domain-containing protein n=1 Tax=Rhodococcus TaxID=1827 RepID=UPI0009337BF2|nr:MULTISPECIES: DUF4192 domain-containing protein [Rhodococcus]NCL75743.1 hypothetical protein [Rhodococcus sp. YH1]WKK14686.1 DUF4192 domain-containing protein [Rhodococcus ruber]
MSERIRIKGIGELIAAVPNILGFTPELSTLLLLFRGDRLVWTARRDFGARQLAVSAEALAKTGESDRVIVVIVTDRTPFADVIAEGSKTKAALLDLGMDVSGIYYTPRIDDGQQWTEVETLQCGTIPAPNATEVAATYAVLGKTVAGSRDEIEARFRRVGTVTLSDRAHARTAKDELGDNFARSVLEELAEAVRTRTEPDAALAARTGLVLVTDVTARDAMLGLALLDGGVAAETMGAIARRLPTAQRVAALTVAGYFSYANGQGVEAGCAFRAAREEATRFPLCDTRFLGLLEQALEQGLHPSMIRELAGTAVRIARERFGIELPAPSGDRI